MYKKTIGSTAAKSAMRPARNVTLASALVAAMTVLLVGCGGGGSDSRAPAPGAGPSAEGVYGGTLTGSTVNRDFQMLVLETGEVWALYGAQTSGQFGVAGFIQGSGSSSNGSFTSPDTRDFGFSPAVSGSTKASYDATAKTVAGTVTWPSGAVSFNGGPVAGSLYDYNKPAALSTIAGVWSAASVTGERISLNVGASGAFTANSSLGCNFSGTVTPRPSGKNVFNVALTFGAAPCALAGQGANGIALAYPLANGKTQLLMVAVDGARQYGSAAFATR